MNFAPKPPPARPAPRGRVFFVPLCAVSPPRSGRMPPRFAPHLPAPSPRAPNLATPAPPLSATRRATFRTSAPADDKALPLHCQNKTTLRRALPQPLRPIAHLQKHPARRSTTHPLISPNRPLRSLKPAHFLPETHPLLPHRPTSLIHFTAMFHTALSALTAFYRTTVVILPLGHHRTLHLHTLPALLLIPYLAQLN